MKIVLIPALLSVALLSVGVAVTRVASRATGPVAAAESSEPAEPAPTTGVVRHRLPPTPTPGSSFAPLLPPSSSNSNAAQAGAAAPGTAASAQEFAQSLELAFYREGGPGKEGAQLKTAITAAFEGPSASDARIRDLECRASRCKMKITFPDLNADIRIMRDFFGMLGDKGIDVRGLRFAVPTREESADGKSIATVHVYRGDDDGLPASPSSPPGV